MKTKWSLALVIIFTTLASNAQIGYQLIGGYAMSKWSATGIGGKFGPGFEVGFGVFAKYSEKLQWQSNITLVSVKSKDNIGYVLEDDQFNSTFKKKFFDIGVGFLSYDYMLDYNLYKEYVGIIGGLGLQFRVPFSDNNSLIDYWISDQDLVGKRRDQVLDIAENNMPDPNILTFNANLGVTFNPVEKIQIFSMINYPINANYENTGFPIKVITLRTGVAIKLMGSPRDRRF